MKRILSILLLSGCVFSGIAQTEKSWKASTNRNVKTQKAVARQSFPKDFQLFELNDVALRQALQTAPQRDFSKKVAGVVISLPNADGNLERFEVLEASNFEPALQAQFPQIRAYVGKGLDDKSAVLRMSSDTKGFSTMVFRTGQKTEFMEPYSEDAKTYAVFRSSREKGALPWNCSTEDVAIASDASRQLQLPNAPNSNTGELLTFRLAMSCNAEYTTFHGGTVPLALAAINNSITRVNGVFETDFAIHMSIIANTTAVIYTNAATDPYTTMANWNNQLQTTLTNNIGEANYDVGHMFGASGGGGNAGCIGCVCLTGKGRGITSPADGIPQGDNFDIDYVAHELGHQFGANHTFSMSVEGTGVNVEPGSGSTIMGYAGITGQDLQAHSDDYFVYASIKQVQDNMVTKTCPVRTTLSNNAPVVNAGLDYAIPKSTPFILTGSATDANGDVLSYCWEQNDSATSQTGGASLASPTKTAGPNFRSFDPVATPVRYMPRLNTVLANTLTTSLNGFNQEAASSVARTLNFVLTARDVATGVGQTGSDATTITVNATAGPFLVTSPNTAVSLIAGSNQIVTWDVAGTTANNVNTAFVDIFLSTDGGLTYPIQIASQVPNDGSETVTIPNNPGTTNRIMVKGYNHIFYDISNMNFTITAAPSTLSVAYSPASGGQNKSACSGSDATYTISYAALGGFSATTTFTATGLPAGATATFSPTAVSASGDVTLTIGNTAAATPGTYPIVVTATSGATTKTVPLYLQLFSAGFSGATLTAPANNATAQNTTVSLTWGADANATSYDIEVATDAAFTTVVISATVTGTTYSATGLLEGTNYFWRVRPKNPSCSGVFGSAFAFQTGQIICNTAASTNVPLTIAATGAPTVNSTLAIASGVTISDVNVSVNITHTYVGDLTLTLISPTGVQVPLAVGQCGEGQNINVTFDDSGANFICGASPAISGTLKPSSPLSVLNGSNSAGTWTLRVADGFNLDGGTLNSWSLNVCSVQALGVADRDLSDFAIYPNPNNGTFNIRFTPNASSDIQIDVHDIRGRQILKKNYQNNGLFDENLQLDGASAGIYLVTVQNGSAKETRKIVVR
ncbi:reprolysin-like metallopeptidase [Flavobacterium sp.]|uniref:zinc-dependent metalloprotease n=1 Tax=Flavobacterium sp. TaxID=239 RepID=UPI001224289D|nr:zinc-dependent metalloprotease family protein [Flavobacterium sp.]RZJ71772.1 MAG: T9SS type A sorting domain-containing protein [Flavobacterium sp.]